MLTPSVLFVVVLTTGSYDDRTSRPILVYSDKIGAERHADSHNREAHFLSGKISARDILVADWWQSNSSGEPDEGSLFFNKMTHLLGINKMNNEWHGWYSKIASEEVGTNRYTTPDGAVVEVTFVTSGPKRTDAFADTKYVGTVTRWHSQGKQGTSTPKINEYFQLK